MSTVSKPEIAQWCQAYVGELLAVPADQIDLDASFDRLGLDSALAVSLLVEVEQRYGVELPTDAFFEHPNLGAVADHLSAQIERRGS